MSAERPTQTDSNIKLPYCERVVTQSILTEEQKQQILRLREIGCTYKEIAEQLNTTIAVVYRYSQKLIQAGELKPSKDKPPKDWQQILELYRAGLSNNKIADKLKVRDATIKFRIKKIIYLGLLNPEEVKKPNKNDAKPSIRATYYQRINQKYEQAFDQFLIDHPNEPINFTKVAKMLGVTTEAVRQQYKRIGERKTVPPVRKKIAPEALDRIVSDLAARGYDTKTMTKELFLYQVKEVREAIARHNKKQKADFYDRCIKLRKEGFSNTEIAQITGKKVDIIINIFIHLYQEHKDLRLRKPRTPKKELDERGVLVLDLIKQGLSVQQIAKKLGIDIQAARYAIARLYVHTETRPNKRRKNLSKEQVAALDQEMRQLFNQGLSYMEVESHFKVSHGTFYRRFDYLRSQGLLPAPYDKKINYNIQCQE